MSGEVITAVGIVLISLSAGLLTGTQILLRKWKKEFLNGKSGSDDIGNL